MAVGAAEGGAEARQGGGSGECWTASTRVASALCYSFPLLPFAVLVTPPMKGRCFWFPFFAGGASSDPLGMRADKMYVPAAKRADLWDDRL